jgi:hypothetical protein
VRLAPQIAQTGELAAVCTPLESIKTKELFVRLQLPCTAILFFIFTSRVFAAWPLPEDPLERRCWLSYTADRAKEDLRDTRAVNFSALRSGFEVYSPFQVDFSVRGMGVAPAGVVADGSGHHHLLINTPLPIDVSEKIPFSDNHKHFGKAQTGGVIALAPGTHKLRLLFADHDHRPYYVFSEEITFNVKTARAQLPDLRIDPSRFAQTCARWYQNAVTTPRPPGSVVYVKNIRDDEPVQSPFTLKFGVEGFGVCTTKASAPNTGFFSIDVLRAGTLVRRIDLKNGETQFGFDLPSGSYVVRLRFLDSTGRELLPTFEQRLRVV